MTYNTNKQTKVTTIKLTHFNKTIIGVTISAFAWGMWVAWMLCGMPV